MLFTLLTTYILPAQAASFEQPGDLSAEAILDPGLLHGKNYAIKDVVRNDGLFNYYTVDSDFGTFEAASTTSLKILLNEINAIADMKNQETDDTAMAALKESGANTVEGVKQLFNDPNGTVQGAASGVGSLFNRAKIPSGNVKVVMLKTANLSN